MTHAAERRQSLNSVMDGPMNYEQFQDTSWGRRKSTEPFEIRSEDCQLTLQWNGGI